MSGITFAQFLYGEIGQESGGDYRAQSPAGALGKYQILSSNVAAWSQEILGHSITPQQFLANPNLQDAIAIGKLHKYFTQYGPEGAASAWYTGSPTAWQSGGGGDNYGGPSAAGYVSSVMQRAQGYQGDGSDLTHSGQPVQNAGQVAALSSATGGGSANANATGGKPTGQDYSGVDDLGTLFQRIPELRTLIGQAESGSWSIQRFTNAVEDSDWWKQHSSAARGAIIKRANDPASWRQDLQNLEGTLGALGKQLGFTGLDQATIENIATSAIMSGNQNNNDWLTQALGQRENYRGTTSGGDLNGQMAATYGQLQTMSKAYGLTYSASSLAAASRQIVMGNNSIDHYRQTYEDLAAGRYPGIADQIRSGQTVQQIADPYIQSYAQLLELDPNSIGLNNGLIQQALQGTPGTQGKAGSQVTGAMPLYQFEKLVRNDPKWQYTQGAKDQISTALMKVGQDFGFAGGF